jgi:hypothetical protein
VGNDASSMANIPSNAQVMMVSAASDAIVQCWEWADWPELCNEEERTVQGDETVGFYIDFEQVGETPMGEVFAVYLDNPATHVLPRQLSYTLLGDKIQFPGESTPPGNVYVRYRTRPTTYTAANLTAAVPAVLGRAVSYLLAASLLEEDGQMDKALLMEQKAEAELIAERDKYVFQQNQPGRWSAQTSKY